MHVKRCLWSLVMVALGGAPLALDAQPQQPGAETVLDTLAKGHPRLMLTDEALAALKARHDSDPALARIVRGVVASAEEELGARPLVHKLVGPRLLSVSRECLDRVYTLAVAYRWTGDVRFAEAAKQNALTVCAFPDWNPSHFLDTAEMSHAVGIAYDWLYGYLTPDERTRIASRLEALGIDPALAAYAKNAGFMRSDYNWNQVCNGGMLTGALAIAEVIPEKAGTVVANAVWNFPRALASYGPDGVWAEGPSYWHYATRYTAYGLTALDTALGTTFGLTEVAGMAVTGDFPVYMTGPTGYYFNFADVGERSRRGSLPCLFWLARTYGNPFYADVEHEMIAEHGGDASHLLWYVPPSGGEAPELLLDRYFRGDVEIVVMRSSWSDPAALWAGIKAGYNQANHGHLDVGSFELDALGVRWVRDLGSDDYNLPGYWNKQEGGSRWNYYRLNSFSHNVPILNGKNQHAEAEAKVLDTEFAGNQASVTLDLTSAYPGAATSITRQLVLARDTQSVTLTDAFDLRESTDVRIGFLTDAAIDIRNAHTAVLSLDGKQMEVTLDAPDNVVFAVESAEQQPPQKRNRGVSRLLAQGELESGTATVSVCFAGAKQR